MASKYWIKLYHEILDDPKMGQLPDRAWRRVIELFLLAGELDSGGLLPPVGDIAWRLRVDETELLEDLSVLEDVGIIRETDDGWLVCKFAERQAAVPAAERMRRMRERRRKEQYYQRETAATTGGATEEHAAEVAEEQAKVTRGITESVTENNARCGAGVTKRNTDTDTDTEYTTTASARARAKKPPPPEQAGEKNNAFALYEQAAGVLSPLVVDGLKDLIDECESHRLKLPQQAAGSEVCGDGWVRAAIRESQRAGARVSVNYLSAIVDRWRREGFESKFSGGNNGRYHAGSRNSKSTKEQGGDLKQLSEEEVRIFQERVREAANSVTSPTST